MDIYDKKPLRYAAAADGNSFRVWSVGSDGVDDGSASHRKRDYLSTESEDPNAPIVHYGAACDCAAYGPKDVVLTWTRPGSQPVKSPSADTAETP